MRMESFTGALWITLIVIALLLMVGSQIASVRRWASGAIGGAVSLFSSLGALGARVAGSLGGAKALIVAIPLLLGMGFGLTECVKESGRNEVRLEIAEGETEVQKTINGRDASIAEIGQDVALLRQEIRNLSQRGRNELAAAAPANEAPIDAELVRVWRANLDGMCVPRQDGSSADSCAG